MSSARAATVNRRNCALLRTGGDERTADSKHDPFSAWDGLRKVAQKAGLNREILDTAPALLMQLLRYKVLETGGLWVEAPTRKLKPSQTCPACGYIRKKSLSERTHECEACGHSAPRDIASACVVLNWALYGASGQELAEAGDASCETPSNSKN